jgi:catechol 2,3-dioxygenase-like lactoylglutathione lyase family enzyme
MIGRLHSVVIDCPDPKVLAEFYSAVLGTSVTKSDDDWWQIDDGQGGKLSFQQVTDYQPPRWPSQDQAQQFHLDIMVDDVDVAEKQVLALGATRLPGEGNDFRVYADPAGHPFCLVW